MLKTPTVLRCRLDNVEETVCMELKKDGTFIITELFSFPHNGMVSGGTYVLDGSKLTLKHDYYINLDDGEEKVPIIVVKELTFTVEEREITHMSYDQIGPYYRTDSV